MSNSRATLKRGPINGSQSSRLGVQKFGDLDRASGAQPRVDLSDKESRQTGHACLVDRSIFSFAAQLKINIGGLWGEVKSSVHAWKSALAIYSHDSSSTMHTIFPPSTNTNTRSTITTTIADSLPVLLSPDSNQSALILCTLPFLHYTNRHFDMEFLVGFVTTGCTKEEDIA